MAHLIPQRDVGRDEMVSIQAKVGAGHECYEYDTPGWPPYAVFKLVPWLHGHLRFQKASGPSGPHGFHGHLGSGRS